MEITCDICPGGTPMQMIKRLPNIKRKTRPGHYRVRRYQCPICGHQQTIHAGGSRDVEQYQKEYDQALQERHEQDQREKDELTDKFD